MDQFFHLEFLGPVHVKISSFEPDLISYFPWGEFGGYLFLHFLLGDLVSGLGIITGGRKVGESGFQIGQEGFAKRRICPRFVSHHE